MSNAEEIREGVSVLLEKMELFEESVLRLSKALQLLKPNIFNTTIKNLVKSTATSKRNCRNFLKVNTAA